MALHKTKSWRTTAAHVFAYALPFLALTTSWKALLVIAGSHAIIDHYRLARHVGWVKNWLAPRWMEDPETKKKVANLPWRACAATGYPPDKPAWMAVWLMIIVDQLMHVLCNGLALKYL